MRVGLWVHARLLLGRLERSVRSDRFTLALSPRTNCSQGGFENSVDQRLRSLESGPLPPTPGAPLGPAKGLKLPNRLVQPEDGHLRLTRPPYMPFVGNLGRLKALGSGQTLYATTPLRPSLPTLVHAPS